MQREADESVVPVKECMALVDRIAGSQELRRAARLRAFLLYVAEQTLKTGGGNLREQEIGAAVFGRPPFYDTGVDNIVRVNATELRKRLEHYFAGEGAGETTVLEIPRGSYAPVFRRREAALPSHGHRSQAGIAEEPLAEVVPVSEAPKPSAEALLLLEPVSPPLRRSSDRRLIRMWQAAAAALLLACLALAWQNRSMAHREQPWRRSPALRSFWGEFFRQDEPSVVTDVVLADTSLALAEDILQRTVSLTDYVNYNYKRLAESPALSAERREALSLVLERNNGSIGDFRVAQQVMTLESDPARLQLKFAREYTAQAARHNSLILIGSRKSNPWVELFADRLNFDFEYDAPRHRTSIVNRKPQAGERSVYPAEEPGRTASDGEPPATGYGVIASLPSLSGKGRVLILEGTDSQATAATGDFITNEDSLAAFKRRLPEGPTPFFEVLLRTSQLSGTPIHAEVVAYRVYPR